VEQHIAKLRDLAEAGVDQFNLYLMNGDEERAATGARSSTGGTGAPDHPAPLRDGCARRRRRTPPPRERIIRMPIEDLGYGLALYLVAIAAWGPRRSDT
jgi:hypothetical protein